MRYYLHISSYWSVDFPADLGQPIYGPVKDGNINQWSADLSLDQVRQVLVELAGGDPAHLSWDIDYYDYPKDKRQRLVLYASAPGWRHTISLYLADHECKLSNGKAGARTLLTYPHSTYRLLDAILDGFKGAEQQQEWVQVGRESLQDGD